MTGFSSTDIDALSGGVTKKAKTLSEITAVSMEQITGAATANVDLIQQTAAGIQALNAEQVEAANNLEKAARLPGKIGKIYGMFDSAYNVELQTQKLRNSMVKQNALQNQLDLQQKALNLTATAADAQVRASKADLDASVVGLNNALTVNQERRAQESHGLSTTSQRMSIKLQGMQLERAAWEQQTQAVKRLDAAGLEAISKDPNHALSSYASEELARRAETRAMADMMPYALAAKKDDMVNQLAMRMLPGLDQEDLAALGEAAKAKKGITLPVTGPDGKQQDVALSPATVQNMVSGYAKYADEQLNMALARGKNTREFEANQFEVNATKTAMLKFGDMIGAEHQGTMGSLLTQIQNGQDQIQAFVNAGNVAAATKLAAELKQETSKKLDEVLKDLPKELKEAMTGFFTTGRVTEQGLMPMITNYGVTDSMLERPQFTQAYAPLVARINEEIKSATQSWVDSKMPGRGQVANDPKALEKLLSGDEKMRVSYSDFQQALRLRLTQATLPDGTRVDEAFMRQIAADNELTAFRSFLSLERVRANPALAKLWDMTQNGVPLAALKEELVKADLSGDAAGNTTQLLQEFYKHVQSPAVVNTTTQNLSNKPSSFQIYRQMLTKGREPEIISMYANSEYEAAMRRKTQLREEAVRRVAELALTPKDRVQRQFGGAPGQQFIPQ